MNVQEYFKASLASALSNQKIVAEEDTVYYLVNLLAYYCRAEHLFELTSEGVVLQPLAMRYARAVQADNPAQRRQTLRCLGDVALLIAGFFSGSLSRKAVDVDYYIGMGRSAYGYLSDTSTGSAPARTLAVIYCELSSKFDRFVDVLAEVSESSRQDSSSDILRLYEIWIMTGSPRAANKLRKIGIEPVPGTSRHRVS
ncbi:MAG: hypothetical protein PHE55_14535 [Methylococcaceae bacterium]|nr:hypothetical protein [Methylococcaceae bacterium]